MLSYFESKSFQTTSKEARKMSTLFTVGEDGVSDGIQYVLARARRTSCEDFYTFPFPAVVAGCRNMHNDYFFMSLNGPAPQADRIRYATLRAGQKNFFLTQGQRDGTALIYLAGPWEHPTLLTTQAKPCSMRGKDAYGRCPLCGAPERCGAHSLEERYPFETLGWLDVATWDHNDPHSGMVCTYYWNGGTNEQIMFLAEPIEVRLPSYGNRWDDVKVIWDGTILSMSVLADKDLGNLVNP